MGIFKCETHGLQGIALVAPALGAAIEAKVPMPAKEIARVLYTTIDDEEYPPVRAWLVRDSPADIGDRVLPIDEMMALETEGACTGCVNDWLCLNGVDPGYSTAEQRFLRMNTLLMDLLRPRLEPALKAISNLLFANSRAPTGHGFAALVDRPFIAHCDCRPADWVRIEVRDHRDHVVGTARSSLAKIPISSEAATSGRVNLVDGELDQAGTEALLRWVDEVERLLREGLNRMS